MKELLWVGLGGFVGANARYLLGGWVAGRFGGTVPYGTFAVNVGGSFALGLIMGALDTYTLPPAVRLAVAIGLLGAFTTFSTFTYETLRLLEDGSVLLASANIVGSVLVGLLAALIGLAAGRAL